MGLRQGGHLVDQKVRIHEAHGRALLLGYQIRHRARHVDVMKCESERTDALFEQPIDAPFDDAMIDLRRPLGVSVRVHVRVLCDGKGTNGAFGGSGKQTPVRVRVDVNGWVVPKKARVCPESLQMRFEVVAGHAMQPVPPNGDRDVEDVGGALDVTRAAQCVHDGSDVAVSQPGEHLSEEIIRESIQRKSFLFPARVAFQTRPLTPLHLCDRSESKLMGGA